jgi:hypothetical protein
VVNQVIQCTEARVGNEHDIPTTSAVAACGAAKRDVLLAPKRDGTLAARAGFDS